MTTRHHGTATSVVGQDAPDGPGPAGEPGILGHVAVAHHLARGERAEHVEDPLLAARRSRRFSMAVAS